MKMIAMCFLGFALSMICTMGAESGLEGLDDQPMLSQQFRQKLYAADQAGDTKELAAIYEQSKLPAERAELELALGRIYCQRTGLVDPAQAIKWYDRALVRELPVTALAKQFILRGNMHERLKHTNEALADYVRGLLICLQFNLPEKPAAENPDGKLVPPPINNGIDAGGGNAEAERLEHAQRYADYRRERAMQDNEHDLISLRYYYVEAIKRVLEHEKLKEPALKEITERLTNRKDRLEEALRRVRELNPNPFQ